MTVLLSFLSKQTYQVNCTIFHEWLDIHTYLLVGYNDNQFKTNLLELIFYSECLLIPNCEKCPTYRTCSQCRQGYALYEGLAGTQCLFNCPTSHKKFVKLDNKTLECRKVGAKGESPSTRKLFI